MRKHTGFISHSVSFYGHPINHSSHMCVSVCLYMFTSSFRQRAGFILALRTSINQRHKLLQCSTEKDMKTILNRGAIHFLTPFMTCRSEGFSRSQKYLFSANSLREIPASGHNPAFVRVQNPALNGNDTGC